jgi:hypothetical protein
MEAASNIEKSVNFYETTRRNIPEDNFILVAVTAWILTQSFCIAITRTCLPNQGKAVQGIWEKINTVIMRFLRALCTEINIKERQ